MTDLLTTLARRTLGVMPVAQPIIASRFAPPPAMPGLDGPGYAPDAPETVGTPDSAEPAPPTATPYPPTAQDHAPPPHTPPLRTTTRNAPPPRRESAPAFDATYDTPLLRTPIDTEDTAPPVQPAQSPPPPTAQPTQRDRTLPADTTPEHDDLPPPPSAPSQKPPPPQQAAPVPDATQTAAQPSPLPTPLPIAHLPLSPSPRPTTPHATDTQNIDTTRRTQQQGPPPVAPHRERLLVESPDYPAGGIPTATDSRV
jgi:hypothetical protein